VAGYAAPETSFVIGRLVPHARAPEVESIVEFMRVGKKRLGF